MLDEHEFADVTLVCDDAKQMEAHKFVLSSGSNFFKTILKNNPHNHPLIYMKGVKATQLELILKFMYFGQVDVPQMDVSSFLEIATELKIKGLTEKTGKKKSETNSNENNCDKNTSKIASKPAHVPNFMQKKRETHLKAPQILLRNDGILDEPTSTKLNSKIAPKPAREMKLKQSQTTASALHDQVYVDAEDQEMCNMLDYEMINNTDAELQSFETIFDTSLDKANQSYESSSQLSNSEDGMVEDTSADKNTKVISTYLNVKDLVALGSTENQSSFHIFEKELKEMKPNNFGKYPCPKCDYESKDRGSLKKHYLSRHMGIIFQCGKCTKEFTSQSGLRSHMELVHDQYSGSWMLPQ